MVPAWSTGQDKEQSVCTVKKDKILLRREINHRIRELTSAEIAAKSSMAADRFLQLDILRRMQPRYLLAFSPMRYEIDPGRIIQWAAERNMRIALPRIQNGSGSLQFHLVGDPRQYSRNLERHRYGFYQPKQDSTPLNLQEVSRENTIILVPGLAFNRQGHRLGRGGGYYDTFLAEHHKDMVSVGICLHEQIVEEIPFERHDMPVDMLISD